MARPFRSEKDFEPPPHPDMLLNEDDLRLWYSYLYDVLKCFFEPPTLPGLNNTETCLVRMLMKAPYGLTTDTLTDAIHVAQGRGTKNSVHVIISRLRKKKLPWLQFRPKVRGWHQPYALTDESKERLAEIERLIRT